METKQRKTNRLVCAQREVWQQNKISTRLLVSSLYVDGTTTCSRRKQSRHNTSFSVHTAVQPRHSQHTPAGQLTEGRWHHNLQQVETKQKQTNRLACAQREVWQQHKVSTRLLVSSLYVDGTTTCSRRKQSRHKHIIWRAHTASHGKQG
jgi:hypothetical protein